MDFISLRPFANTDRQKEVLEACISEGSQRAASRKLGICETAVRNNMKLVKSRAARQGWSPEHGMTRTAPDGFHLRGVSTYYEKTEEGPAQWVKIDADKQRQRELFAEMVQELARDLPRVAEIPAPKEVLSDLMCVYPIGDHHMGMLAWKVETGKAYDIKRSEQVLAGASSYLLRSMPDASNALITVLGDFFHYDGFEAVTPTARNHLDADSRYPHMVRAGIRSLRRVIERAAEKHAHVHVIVEIGNHDLSTSVFLMECLSNIYENNDRITIDTSPMHYHYYRFGSTLIGTHHGHGAKMQQLPMIMAADRPQDWGETEYRYWYTGHIHHSKTQAATSGQDFTGCRVESFRVLAPQDAYHHQKGYRSMQDMKGIVIHRDAGEVIRHTVNPRMLGIT